MNMTALKYQLALDCRQTRPYSHCCNIPYRWTCAWTTGAIFSSTVDFHIPAGPNRGFRFKPLADIGAILRCLRNGRSIALTTRITIRPTRGERELALVDSEQKVSFMTRSLSSASDWCRAIAAHRRLKCQKYSKTLPNP